MNEVLIMTVQYVNNASRYRRLCEMGLNQKMKIGNHWNESKKNRI